jgi:DNA-directed RNA polymerase specialized sigma24 family protein
MDDDQEIVAHIMHGDASGAGAFDQYAYELYAYCRSQLAQEADAATAVQDTFIIVSAKLPVLRDPSRMRAWLFAIARSQCQGRVQGGGSQAADMTNYAEAFTASPQETQLSSVVLTALGELKASEREVLELNVRHELDGADLADVLGIPRNRSATLAAEVRSRFETSVGALIAASPPEEQSTGWTSLPDDTLTGRRSARDRSAAAMLGLLMLTAVPASLREDVTHLLTDPSPGPTAYRERVIRRSNSFRADGFPVQQGSPPAGSTLGRGRAMAAAAAVAVLVLVGGGALFVKMNAHGSSPSAVTQPEVSNSTSAGSTAPSKHGVKARSAKAGSTSAPAGSGVVGNQIGGVPSSAASPVTSKTAKKSPSPTAKPTPTKTKTATPKPTPTTPVPTTPVPTTPVPTTPVPTTPTPTTSSGAQHGAASLITVLLDLI